MREPIEIQVQGRVLILMALWLLTVPFRWVIGAVIAALLHELGHMAALWALGIPIMEVKIDLGGAVIRTGVMEPGEELGCVLAGPVSGLLLCLFWRWFPEAATCAAVQSMFNLLPIYPLDGGRALGALRNICCKAGEKGVQ